MSSVPPCELDRHNFRASVFGQYLSCHIAAAYSRVKKLRGSACQPDRFNYASSRFETVKSEKKGDMPKVKVNDVEIYYEEYGKGRPMVFLSETACDGEVWKINQVGEFSRDHRVIIHDYRGTGQSSKPSIDYTTRMFAEDIVALMDHLGLKTLSWSAIRWAAGSRSYSLSIILKRSIS